MHRVATLIRIKDLKLSLLPHLSRHCSLSFNAWVIKYLKVKQVIRWSKLWLRPLHTLLPLQRSHTRDQVLLNSWIQAPLRILLGRPSKRVYVARATLVWRHHTPQSKIFPATVEIHQVHRDRTTIRVINTSTRETRRHNLSRRNRLLTTTKHTMMTMAPKGKTRKSITRTKGRMALRARSRVLQCLQMRARIAAASVGPTINIVREIITEVALLSR